MLLSDRGIRRRLADPNPEWRLVIDPLGENAIQPASVDLRLAEEILTYTHAVLDVPMVLDPQVGVREGQTRQRTISEYWVFWPNEFLLASTIERIEVPRDLAGQLKGKSSLARLGLIVESAGFFDPGFQGQATLELKNVGKAPILLRPGMKICQISFTVLDQPAERPYGAAGLGSKYQQQVGPTAARPSSDSGDASATR